MRYIKYFLLVALCVASLDADTSKRTNLKFSSDEYGNLNPIIFIPVYYGTSNEFFSAIGYASSNYKDTSSVNGFADSKNALVSSSKELLVNYISYSDLLFGYEASIGVQSNFSQVQNDEFGYIHDSANFFGNGTDYYIAFDNEVKLDIQRHAIRADISLPIGKYFDSRLVTSISPFTNIGVKQSTLFKPLVDKTGSSSSKTNQDISYDLYYVLQVKTGTFIDIGALVSYDNQPLKYDVAQLAKHGTSYVFETNTVDTTETRLSYLVKLIFKVEIMGGLNPSIGYGIENLDIKDNITNKIVSNKKTLLTFGFEKRF